MVWLLFFQLAQNCQILSSQHTVSKDLLFVKETASRRWELATHNEIPGMWGVMCRYFPQKKTKTTLQINNLIRKKPPRTMTPHWRKQFKEKVAALSSWSSKTLIVQVTSGIWWLQWYSPKQIPIMSSCINSFLFLLPSSVPQNQKQAKPKVISDTHMCLPGRRLFLATRHCAWTLSPVLCKMELLNHLISMAAPWKYHNTAVWLGMHENTHTLLYFRGDRYAFLSSTQTKRWMWMGTEKCRFENWH